MYKNNLNYKSFNCGNHGIISNLKVSFVRKGNCSNGSLFGLGYSLVNLESSGGAR